MTRMDKILSTLSLAHAERMDQLIGTGPLYKKPVDEFLLKLKLVELYDPEAKAIEESVQLTDLGVIVFEHIHWPTMFAKMPMKVQK